MTMETAVLHQLWEIIAAFVYAMRLALFTTLQVLYQQHHHKKKYIFAYISFQKTWQKYGFINK